MAATPLISITTLLSRLPAPYNFHNHVTCQTPRSIKAYEVTQEPKKTSPPKKPRQNTLTRPSISWMATSVCCIPLLHLPSQLNSHR